MPRSAGEKLGPYKILAVVGKGGMGEVYRAHDDRLHRDVAIGQAAQRLQLFTVAEPHLPGGPGWKRPNILKRTLAIVQLIDKGVKELFLSIVSNHELMSIVARANFQRSSEIPNTAIKQELFAFLPSVRGFDVEVIGICLTSRIVVTA